MKNTKIYRFVHPRFSFGTVSIQGIALLLSLWLVSQIQGEFGFVWNPFAGNHLMLIWGQFLIASGIILIAGCIPYLFSELFLLAIIFVGSGSTLMEFLKTDTSIKASACVFLALSILLFSGTLAGNISIQVTDLLVEQIDRWLDTIVSEDDYSLIPKLDIPFHTILGDILRIYVCLIVPWTGCSALFITILQA